MCQPTDSKVISKQAQPSFIARYVALSVTVGTFSVWHKLTFVNEEEGVPGLDFPLHSIKFPLGMIAGYLISLPVMNYFVSKYLAPRYDMKALLFESMVFYNVAQVCMNVWMVWRFVNAVVNRGHPFIGNTEYAAGGTTFAIWVHYTNKYLEFLDTYFMVLRGKMDQVSNHKGCEFPVLFSLIFYENVQANFMCYFFYFLVKRIGIFSSRISPCNHCTSMVGWTFFDAWW